MNCMKCGKTTTNEQVFCDDCLQVMAKHPVKPGTPIYLPQRQETNISKKTGRKVRQITPEEQVKLLQKANRKLRRNFWIVLGVLVLLLGFTVWQFISGELLPGFLSSLRG